MPTLHWATKSLPAPIPASLQLDSVIYPGGAGYPYQLPANQLIWGENLRVMWALLPEFEGKVDLILVGHSGLSGVWAAFLGTTAEKVSRHAPCSVLIVR